MTQDELRELDCFIAEHVFKMHRVAEGEMYFYPSIEMVEQIKKDCPDVIAFDYFRAPEYSSPSGFFLLLSKLIADGWMFEIRSPFMGEGLSHGYWGINFYHPEKRPQGIFGSYSDLPLGLASMAKVAYSKPEAK